MSVIAVITYNVTDPETYARYNPGSMPAIMSALEATGGSVVGAGHPEYVQGDARASGVLLRFPDKTAFQAWLDHPDYAAPRKLREASTDAYTIFFVDAFPPG